MLLRVATLNVAGTKHEWLEHRAPMIIQGLREMRPDIVCLQESTIRRAGRFYDQSLHIAEEVGLGYLAFSPYGNPVETISPEQGGLAILSRWPLKRVRNIRLPAAHVHPTDARVAILALIETPDGLTEILNTHLSWQPGLRETRLMQMGLVFENFKDGAWVMHATGPIVMGDFNATEEEPVIQFLSEYMQDAWRSLHPNEPGYTWSNQNQLTHAWGAPERRLDYIFCPRSIIVQSSQIIFNQGHPYFASDHFGLMAELQLNPPQEKVSALETESVEFATIEIE